MSLGSKARILEVARELFYHRGYLATSVDDIIAEAKVAKSNFYYHFKSKEDLGIAVLEVRCGDFEAARNSTLCNQDLSPKDRLSSFLGLLFRPKSSQHSAGCPFGNLVAEMSEHSERFRCYLSRLFMGMASMIQEVIAEGQALGQFRGDADAETASTLIVEAVQGAQLMMKCHKTQDLGARSIELLQKLIEAAPPQARL
jgi:TetR/AcrR family transcriptional repressor of nem operon